MENKIFFFVIDMLARMLGMTPDEVVSWMISMIKKMSPTEDLITQIHKAWGIELFNYIDRPRKEVYICDTSAMGTKRHYKVRWCPGITTIQQRTFVGVPPIEELIIPETVTRIEGGAFGHIDALSRIEFPNGLTSIPSFVCSNCSELEQVQIPETVKKIEYGAFFYCRNLYEIRIPESVMEIAENAFTGCDSLPETVKNHIRIIGGPKALGEAEEDPQKKDRNE